VYEDGEDPWFVASVGKSSGGYTVVMMRDSDVIYQVDVPMQWMAEALATAWCDSDYSFEGVQFGAYVGDTFFGSEC